MQVADTVLVAEAGKNPEVATHTAMKTLDKVSYVLNVSVHTAEAALPICACVYVRVRASVCTCTRTPSGSILLLLSFLIVAMCAP